MSYRLNYVPTSFNSIPIKGGTFVCYPPSAVDITGSSYVVCDKHPNNPIPVNFNFTSLEHNVLTLQRKAIEALENCPGCKEVEQWEKTRFPEGAEI